MNTQFTEDVQIMRLALEDEEWSSAILTEAFLAVPPITKLFSRPEHVARDLDYFMRCNCRYALQHGEAYATRGRDGVALWLRPGHSSMTVAGMWRAGMFAAPYRYGLKGLLKVLVFACHVDKMHRQFASMPHYYLFLTGVLPERQMLGLSNPLLGHMLQRIDAEQQHAYLETQSERNVELYQKFGFEVMGAQAFPFQKNFRNWAMLRKPR